MKINESLNKSIDPEKTVTFEEGPNGDTTLFVGGIPLQKPKISRTRFKVDVELLKGNTGISKLKKDLEKVNFDSDNNWSNLETLLSVMRKWAHGMCPHMSFDDVCDKLEMLSYRKLFFDNPARQNDKIYGQDSIPVEALNSIPVEKISTKTKLSIIEDD